VCETSTIGFAALRGYPGILTEHFRVVSHRRHCGLNAKSGTGTRLG
jgi:hypothetical protein